MSQITVENIKRSSETVARSTRGVAAAWVNFNGTGTIAARDSENVSSLTDNGTGIYRVGHTSAFATANYAVVTGASRSDAIGAVAQELTPRSLTTTQYDVHADYNNGSYVDFENCFAAIFGDIA